MTPAEKEEIRSRVDIVELIGGYTPLKRGGKNFKGLCPFHPEKTPSFVVDPDRGYWRCWGACSTGGDVFTFLMRAENLEFFDAAERLAERAGVAISSNFGGDVEAAQRARDEKDRLFQANAVASQFFREMLQQASLAKEYAEKRGLTHQTLENFAVGYAPDDWSPLTDYLQQHGIHPADAEKAGVISARRGGDGWYDKFRGRLIFPIFDLQERVVAFGGRLLLPVPDAPKYLNSPETPIFSKSRTLYALNRARKAITDQDQALIVEGYTDAVASHQAGIENVVATLGTALTDEHVRLIGRYTKKVVLSFDADDAGVKAALRAAALFEQQTDNKTVFALRILALPPGEDPDSLLAKGEATRFRKAMETALTVPEFRLKILTTRFDTKTDAGKQALLREAIPIVAQVPDQIERDRLIRFLARFYPAISRGAVNAEVMLQEQVRSARDRGQRADQYAAEGPPESPNTFSPANDPPVRLQGERVLPAGARRRNNFERGGWAKNAPQSSQSAQSARSPLPASWPSENPAAMPSVGESAAAVAERTVLQALLSDTWSAKIRGRVPPRLFAAPETAQLMEVLEPLLEGGYAPSEAIALLSNDDLRAHAATLTISADDTPITEAYLADCLRLLEKQQIRRELQEIQRKAENPEGNPVADEELLRRWERKIRLIKQHRSDGDSDAEPV